MYSLTLENSLKNSIELTHNADYSVLEIQWLNPPTATINTSETSLFDGAKYVSSRANMRSMNIMLAINHKAERNRLALLNVVRTNQKICVRYKNSSRNVFIEGYVENIEIAYFAAKQTIAISILCPEPYFKNASQIINEVSLIVGNFHFPFAIETSAPIPFSYYEESLQVNVINVGDVVCGMTVKIYVGGEVINPKIFNRETREFFGIDYTFKNGDEVTIATQEGQKSVTLLREGKTINIFNYISKSSTWLQLDIGDNVFTYEADENGADFMQIRFLHYPLYGGV